MTHHCIVLSSMVAGSYVMPSGFGMHGEELAGTGISVAAVSGGVTTSCCAQALHVHNGSKECEKYSAYDVKYDVVVLCLSCR